MASTLTEMQIKALKEFQAAGKAGLPHRSTKSPDSPHHKTCGVLYQEGYVELGKVAGTYRITKLGEKKLAELRG